MRPIRTALCLLVAFAATAFAAPAAETTSVSAILIMATKEKAPADPRLAPYEANLQRNLPESSFRFVGEGRATLGDRNSRASLSLGSGHVVELQGGTREGDGIRISVVWRNGKATVMNNSFTFQPGVPIVLGLRPATDDNVPIVIVIAK